MNALASLNEADELLLGLVDADQLELGLQRRELKRSLLSFILHFWHTVESQEFIPTRHVEVICSELEDIAYGRNTTDRYIFNIPPGTLKSLIISVFFPAWVWARKPGKRFLTASYAQQLAMRDNLKMREIVTSLNFQKLFPMMMVEDQNTKTKFQNDSNGWRLATSVGGIGTGEHPDYIIIDDPHSAAEADSEVERSNANHWFDRTISSRGKSRGVVVIVVMQRLHMEDLTGHLLSKPGVIAHLYLPMRYEPARPKKDHDPGYTPHPKDWRTVPGELLCPDVFPEHKVKQLENDLGPAGTAGQLQQVPITEGGGLFKREWFKFADAPPKFARWVRGWDTAGTDQGGDYTVGVKLAEEWDWVPNPKDASKKLFVSTGRIFIEDVIRGQWAPDIVDANFLAAARMDGKNVAQREEKEGGASGAAMVQARAKLLKGHDYQGMVIGTNKVTRSKPFRSQAAAGNVYLLRGSWNDQYISELCHFPTAKHDDQVDGTSCAYNSVLLEPPPRSGKLTW